MPRPKAFAVPLADPDEAELREQAARRGLSVRICIAARYVNGGKPIELYARQRPGHPLLGSWATCAAALEWLTGGRT